MPKMVTSADPKNIIKSAIKPAPQQPKNGGPAKSAGKMISKKYGKC